MNDKLISLYDSINFDIICSIQHIVGNNRSIIIDDFDYKNQEHLLILHQIDIYANVVRGNIVDFMFSGNTFKRNKIKWIVNKEKLAYNFTYVGDEEKARYNLLYINDIINGVKSSDRYQTLRDNDKFLCDIYQEFYGKKK